MKNANKTTVLLREPVVFDGSMINRVTFDLIHINQGWAEETNDYAWKNRSHYTEQDVVSFFEQFKFYKVFWTLGENKFLIRRKGFLYIRYVWETTDDTGDSVRVVMDLPQVPTGEGVIVTIFKV